jgi:hypothetical protein
VLLTMYDSRLNLCRQVAEDAKEYFGAQVFRTPIPRNVRLAEAPSFGQPILLYDVQSVGARSYLAVGQELIRRIEEPESLSIADAVTQEMPAPAAVAPLEVIEDAPDDSAPDDAPLDDLMASDIAENRSADDAARADVEPDGAETSDDVDADGGDVATADAMLAEALSDDVDAEAPMPARSDVEDARMEPEATGATHSDAVHAGEPAMDGMSDDEESAEARS